MISRLIEFIGFFLLALMVLGLEQVYGLPWLFFILVAFISERFPTVWRAAWWLLMGVSFAGMYHLSLTLGLVIVMMSLLVFALTDNVIKIMWLRFFLVGLVGLVGTAIVVSFHPTWAASASILMSLIVSFFGFRLVLIQKDMWLIRL